MVQAMPSCRVAHQNLTPPCPQQQQTMGPSPQTSCWQPKAECTAKIKRADLPATKPKRQGIPLSGMKVHHLEASHQLPSAHSNSLPCQGRKRLRLGCVPSPGTAIHWPAPMIRQKSSQWTLGGHFLPLHPFPASHGSNQ